MQTHHHESTQSNSRLNTLFEPVITQEETSFAPPAPMGQATFDKAKVLPAFCEEISGICKIGDDLRAEENQHRSKMQEQAVKALAAILKFRHTYFSDATPEIEEDLLAVLYAECDKRGLKGKTSRTTEFHLLSRLLRKSDRKQASADAKILLRAHKDGQTAETFSAWVDTHGGLSKILKETGNLKNEQKVQSSAKENGNGNALVIAAKRTSWSMNLSYPSDLLPEDLKDLVPAEGTLLPLLVGNRDNVITFYIPKEDSLPTELPSELTIDMPIKLNPPDISESQETQ
ncbi:hypothetical protein [Herbaspirillum sp.]|uniref:hypothetical protein n=1 Tax=Herbaspirillum TaxID=963 RepID=UPI00258B2746|nr:hypothetical protein [Herbaspirillum sp.]MCP3654584.1 hypothetical protein [Herbaspirillum sp.]MCP3948668.1 hypothetical protein [Herbaspirillum sp.]MCP4033247.1 hypothetical protein [Herbaspirillum sp.]MCP4556198.1 hypothetical protein [Herbaspirillum sp.]